MRVVCGWCHHPTPPGSCDYCGRAAAVPWIQRGQAVPAADHDAGQGRPSLDAVEVRRLLDGATSELLAEGRTATVESIAEKLDRSPRTVREWRRRFDV
jgi:hypothetical protein